MAGKFLKRNAIVDFVKSEQRINAVSKRKGLRKYPVSFTLCGCPDPNCGGWHTIREEQTIPDEAEARQLLDDHNQTRKVARKRKVAKKRKSPTR